MTRHTPIAVFATLAFAGSVACGSEAADPVGPGTPSNPPPPPPAVVASLEIGSSSVAVLEGSSATIGIVARDAAGTVIQNPSVLWASNSSAVATVSLDANSSGRVTGAGHGQTTIVATAGTVSIEVTVTVARAGPAYSRSFSNSTLIAARAQLWDVWGRSENDVWMVGADATVVRFDGVAYAALQPSGLDGTMRGVTGVGSTTWVVGAEADGTGVVVRYDDGRETSVTLDGSFPSFWDVWAATSTDVWAVGIGPAPVMRYDGQSWTPFELPGEAFGAVAVWGTGPDDVWILGGSALFRFDGETVEAIEVPATGLISLWGDSQGRVWVSGSVGTVLSYDVDTGVWTDHAGELAHIFPAFAGQDLGAVWGSGPDDVWFGGNGGTLIHYNGASFTRIADTGSGSVPGIWGAHHKVWAVSGQQGGVLIGVDLSQAPPPDGVISDILPSSQAAGQTVTLLGSGFPRGLDARRVRFRTGEVTSYGFGFHSINPSQLLVRLPSNHPVGPATLELLDAVGLPVAPPVNFTITVELAAPVFDELEEMSWSPGSNGCESLLGASESDGVLRLDSGGAIGASAHGLNSVNAGIRLRQGDRTWTLTPHCHHWPATGGSIGVIARLPLSTDLDDQGQIALTAGPAQIQVRNGNSPWSDNRSVTLEIP